MSEPAIKRKAAGLFDQTIARLTALVTLLAGVVKLAMLAGIW